ncbi:FAD:protein FMN transferase [Nocardia niigatensis]|uniref:FAD:protein FMN transferase n=1 Tax=Nocardia niigatensis TaxID=209249 RepID=UPI0002EBF467|nr:FAD:protein FMN transferase [Nocardia niigatensis]
MTAALDRTAATEWQVWSTTARVVVTDPAALRPARTLIRAHLAEVDAACSRFRIDSEISRLCRAAGQPTRISPLLSSHLHAALTAARDTGGDLDPTIGATLIALGYDRDFTLLLPDSSVRAAAKAGKPDAHTPIRAEATSAAAGDSTTAQPESGTTDAAVDGPGSRRTVPSAAAAPSVVDGSADAAVASEQRANAARLGGFGIAGLDGGAAGRRVSVALTSRPAWTDIRVEGELVSVPAGVLLDLGATAKALAADDCARLVAQRFGCGVLVSLGGDIATVGPAPEGGWQVLVEDRPGEPRSRIALPEGAALATSSTLRRRWWRGGSLVHHIVDPRTGVAADPVWRTVSVAAGSCLAANTAATAAVVRGRDAVTGLRAQGLPSRLVSRDGRVITLCGWPQAVSGDAAHQEKVIES